MVTPPPTTHDKIGLRFFFLWQWFSTQSCNGILQRNLVVIKLKKIQLVIVLDSEEAVITSGDTVPSYGEALDQNDTVCTADYMACCIDS